MFIRRMPVFSREALGLTLWAGLAVWLWEGCLFDSGESTLPKRPELLDSIYPGNAVPVRTFELFQPVLDSNLAPDRSSSPRISKPVNVKDFYTGQVVQYRLTTQRFGSWSPELEFRWNYFLLQSNFLYPPDSLPDTAGLEGKTPALYRGMVPRDRFTSYYDSVHAEAQLKSVISSTRSGALGLRVRLTPGGDSLEIGQVVAASPAGRAGLRNGMRILAVNDSSVFGDSALERFQRFSKGDSGTAVELTLLASGSTRKALLVKEPVAFPSVMADSLDGVGYIAIYSFTSQTLAGQSTHSEFLTALAATRRFPVTILDLRENGGGAVDLTLRMADELVPSGVLIREQQREFDVQAGAPLLTTLAYTARSGGKGEGRRFVLMADSLSASASEIFLSAVREGIGSPFLGTRTYGKGVGQVVRHTPGHGLAFITFLKFISRSGEVYHRKGLQPDHPDTSGASLMLAHAVELAHTLVPEAAGKAGAGKAGAAKTGSRLRDLESQAALLEWNRRQGVQRGVMDFYGVDSQ